MTHPARPDNRETESENQRLPAHAKARPRARPPSRRAAEGSSNSGETATDPATGSPIPDGTSAADGNGRAGRGWSGNRNPSDRHARSSDPRLRQPSRPRRLRRALIPPPADRARGVGRGGRRCGGACPAHRRPDRGRHARGGGVPPGRARSKASRARPTRRTPGWCGCRSCWTAPRFSPGVIDGLGGENTRQAIAAYRKANDLGRGRRRRRRPAARASPPPTPAR